MTLAELKHTISAIESDGVSDTCTVVIQKDPNPQLHFDRDVRILCVLNKTQYEMDYRTPEAPAKLVQKTWVAIG